MTFSSLCWVGIGSMFGGMARYALMACINERTTASFPWGTFVVNVSGCLLMGLILGWFERSGSASPALRLFLAVGFCGGFTTFSTFVNDGIGLWTQPGSFMFLLYTAGSLLAGIITLWCGVQLFRSL